MFEIVIVYLLAKRIGGIVEHKGQSGRPYRWMTVGLWFGGEFAGFIIGYAILGRGTPLLAVYPFGLGGAIAGAAIVWALAKQVRMRLVPFWNPTHLTPPAGLPSWAQPNPTLPPMLMIPGNVPLMVESHVGDWALIRAMNGWGGFVDARALLPKSVGSAGVGQPES